MSWRFIAQRVLTQEILDWDVPFTLMSAPVRELSGPGGMTGHIAPEYARLIADDGQPVLQEWDTAVFAELDGQIRGGGLVVKTRAENGQWVVECAGYTTYPHGIPFQGLIQSGTLITPPDPNAGLDKNHDGYIDFTDPPRSVQVTDPPKPYGGPRIDAYDAVRQIWDHLQSYDNGRLGLAVDGHPAGILLGAEDGSDPYELAWWDTPDSGAAIDNLALQVGFDYLEEHAWTTISGNDRTIVHRLRLGTPRLGRKRPDLRFADGENISALATPKAMGEDFANEVLVLGRGEGATMPRLQLARPDGRLRRVHVTVDKAATSEAALRARGNRELQSRTQGLYFPMIEVRDHPNAPVGSWSPGDDILVQAHVPWVGDVEVWHRVISDELRTDGTVLLTLKRADALG
ncbi:hypothetical protein ACFQ0M_48105 [Kitasatospora aburaviensis]|uniref:Minor tail protein n=1 Tax=Kitasatospora aburaviensis TaxID=67265 RepID=A0ABW1F0J6_9ACTN